MKGDFSRVTFDPKKHFRGVRMQQGRVQLDADWNENLDILLHRIETETIDVVGACGVPVHDAAFGVVTDFNSLSQEEKDWLTAQGFNTLGKNDFYLTQGRAYVDGLLVENDNTLPFSQQPFVLPKGQGQISAEGIYLLYLDIWERHLTALEDPSIREVALGGPDTATRTQVTWQAVLANVGKVGDPITCADVTPPWPDPSTGKLSARTQPEEQPDDPCPVPPGAGYKRLENQLYRVEIHKGSDTTGGPTFKWSRDNGSVVVAVAAFKVDGDGAKIQTTSLGRDDVLGLHENDWVEVLDDATELAGQPGTLTKINQIDPDNILTLEDAIPDGKYDLNGHPRVRRWDSDGNNGNGLVLTSGYVDLEDGIQVQFDTSGTYHTGDYWLIPARTVPGQYGDIEWPQEGSDPAALLPFGITHHYCKLALLALESDAVKVLEDCRKKFPPLTELPTGGDRCCSVTVGQGGDYADIQSAINARPTDAEWWTVCILPGQHGLKDTLTVDGAQNLTLSGCGSQSRLLGPADKPTLVFTKGKNIRLDGLGIAASSSSGAILFSNTESITVTNCHVSNGVMALYRPAIVVDSSLQVEIRENELYGRPAIVSRARGVEIRGNKITSGGIQIRPGSLDVTIADNRIERGIGPGIQLGGQAAKEAAAEGPQPVPVATGDMEYTETRARLYEAINGISLVQIAGNVIEAMTGSGIITATDLGSVEGLGDVDGLTIADNRILRCVQEPDVQLGQEAAVGGGIVLSGVSVVQIYNNLIVGNGVKRAPACGIFLFDGSSVEIMSNVVAENGVSKSEEEPTAYQAGIAALMMFGNNLNLGELMAGKGVTIRSGLPAIRIHDNEVTCPAGHALAAIALGPVSVTGNSLASRADRKQPQVLGGLSTLINLAACVSLWNLGPAQQFAGLVGMVGMGRTWETGAAGFAKAVRSLPDGRLMLHDNQITRETAAGETDKDRFVPASVWAFSLDDVSLNGNQIQADVSPNRMLTDVAAAGVTVRAAGNYYNEILGTAFLSYFSLGQVMNVTTSNEAIHCILALGTNRAEAANLEMVDPPGPGQGDVCTRLRAAFGIGA